MNAEPAHLRVSPISPELRGRDRELGRLRERLDLAAAGTGQTVLVEGEPGIGKTRLLRRCATLAARAGFEVLGAQAEQLEQGRPFGVVADALACRAGSPDPRRAEVGRLLGGALVAGGGWGAVADTRFLAREAIVDLIDDLARGQPLLLALDDLQWADPSSLAVVLALARSAEARPLVLLGAFRSGALTAELERVADWLRGEDALHLRLEPLDPADVVAVTAELTGAEPGTKLLEQLSGAVGNPFLVIELLRAAMDDGAIEVASGRAELRTDTLPPSLHRVIIRRLEALAPASLRLLQIGSVLGARFSPVELGAVLDRHVASLHPEIEDSVRAGLLRVDGDRLRFRHDLVREAVYGDLPAPVRAALHDEVARIFAGTGAAPEIVARHAALGGRSSGAEAVAWLRSVARDAADRDPATAAELLDRARRLAEPDDPIRADLLLEEVSALAWSGRVADAEAKARQGLAERRGDGVEAALRAGLGEVLVLQGRMGEAIEPLTDAAGHAGLDEARRARLLAEAATARLWSLDLDGAERDAAAAIQWGERLVEPVPATIGWCVRSRAASLRAEFQRAVDCAERALVAAGDDPAAQRSGPRLYLGIALLHFDPRASDKVLREGRRLSEQLGAPWMLPNYQAALTTSGFYSGEWDDALAEAEAGRLIGEEVGSRVGVVQILGLVGIIAFHRSDLGAARRALADVQAELGAPGASPAGIGYALWLDALLREHDGHVDTVAEPFRPAFAGSAAAGVPVVRMWFGPEAVRLALVAGEVDEARAMADEVCRIASTARTPIAEAAARRCRGLVTGDAGLLLEAVELLRGGPRPLYFAMTCENTGRALARAGRRDEAVAVLTDGLAVFERIGATLVTRRIGGALRKLGAPAGVRGSRARPATGWGSLTPTEHQVVDLVARGLSNPEIGQQLYISRRTVESHLSHVYAKLGVSSRAALAAEVARRESAPA